MTLNDSYQHKGLRNQLVEKIKEKGIVDIAVLDAIAKIPRHLFIPDTVFLKHAYEDKAFPIGNGQTISQPYTVAFQSELLQIKKGDKILEVGTGSGYQSAVLIELGAKVFTIERQRELYLKTQKILPKLGYLPKMFYGDGYKGLPAYAPFDKVIVTAGAPFIPEELLKQMVIGGIMVIPIGEGDVQIMTSIEKKTETEFIKREHGTFRFVPLLKNKS